MIVYMNFTEYFWKLSEKLHSGNVVNVPYFKTDYKANRLLAEQMWLQAHNAPRTSTELALALALNYKLSLH